MADGHGRQIRHPRTFFSSAASVVRSELDLPAPIASARDTAWLEIRARFERGIDWSGLEQARVARWYRQLHIFEYPFYYIEYGIAQMGALQVWRHSLTDQAQAVRQYREALALGGTVGLPEIYRAAGARLVFDAEMMGELVALVEKRLTELRAG